MRALTWAGSALLASALPSQAQLVISKPGLTWNDPVDAQRRPATDLLVGFRTDRSLTTSYTDRRGLPPASAQQSSAVVLPPCRSARPRREQSPLFSRADTDADGRADALHRDPRCRGC